MREPPRRLLLKAPLVPVRVLRGELARDHAASRPEHVAGDFQTLGSAHRPEDPSHLLVQNLEVAGIDRHEVLAVRIAEAPAVVDSPPPQALGSGRLMAKKQRFIRRFFGALGPGVITGAADDDPSGI